MFTAIKEGTATITAKYEGYNDGTYQINVVEQKVTEITLNPSEILIKPGENKQIEASITPDNADNKKIKWTSDDESIAKVDIQACGGTRVGSLDAWEFYCDNDYQWFNKYHSNSLYI